MPDSTSTYWQHRRPKGVDECDADPVRPTATSSRGKERCVGCGDPIMQVDENEGPEALKSFLRF